MTAVQLDLFADPADPRQLDRETWTARFERAEWTGQAWPYDTNKTTLGWVCPACGSVEVNAAVLAINHGYDPAIPGHGSTPFGADCTVLRHRRFHAAENARKAAA